MTDVTRAAEVAEQTVYNYFSTKEQLVTDRGARIQDRLVDLILSRPRGAASLAVWRRDRAAVVGMFANQGSGPRN